MAMRSEAPEGEREEGRPDERGGTSGCPRSRRAKRRRGSARRAAPTSVGAAAGAPVHGERSAGGGARGGPPRRAWGHQRVPPFTESEAPEGEREEGRPDERGGTSGCPRSRRAKRR